MSSHARSRPRGWGSCSWPGDRLEQLADELRARHRVEVRVIAADLSRAEDVGRMIDETASIDLGMFVAAAGFGTSGGFLEAKVEDELSMLEVNCRAVIAMTHALGRRLTSRGRGGVVLLSSLLAFQAVPRAAHYAATKAFIQTFAEGLRRELAPRGVDVLACAPGPIASGFGARADMKMGMAIPATFVPMPTLRALGRRRTARPGWLSWLLELSLATLPRWGRRWVLARIMANMTQHHA